MTARTMRVWRPVILIGIATAVGLGSALLGDGWWDWLSAVTLSIPVAVAGWMGLRKDRSVRATARPHSRR